MYTFPPRAANSSDLSRIPIARSSWLIFIEQNFGPHIEQKWAVLAGAAGNVSS
jgi:hypothetical protein